MRQLASLLLISFLAVLCGCSSSSTNQPSPAAGESAATPASSSAAATATPVPAGSPGAAAAKGKVDACSLLTSADIQPVQGEPLKDTKPSDRVSGNLITSTCYYELPTPSNSISLSLTQNDPAKQGQTTREFWKERFGALERKPTQAGEKTRSEPEKREGEEESAALEPVSGLGDEAFWSGSRIGGALYVLKGNRYLRISVGGAGDKEAKLKKSKKLAQAALRKM
jgi:hypothetical protein